MLLLVLHQFAAAKLEMGDPLRDLMQHLMDEDTESRAKIAAGEGSDHLARVAEELDGNPFAIHAYLDEHAEAVPKELRADILLAAFNDAEPALREAVIGFLFSSSAAIRFKLAEMLEVSAPHALVSPTMLRRMIGLRNWLPAEERPALDRAYQGLSSRRVSPARVGQPPRSAKCSLLSSTAQARTVFWSSCRRGAERAVAALLAKLGAGIRDAWVKHETTDAELREILGQFSAEAVIMPSTLGYATAAARYFLAMHVAARTMPPFGLIDFAETVGLTSLNPEAMPVKQLLDTLSKEIDSARLSSKGIADSLANSARWSEQPMLETWFEDTAEVRQVLAKRLPKTMLRNALLSELLPDRRQEWAELLAWSAFAKKHQPDCATWEDMVVVARELLGDRPLGDFPIMRTIADRTLAVHRQRNAK